MIKKVDLLLWLALLLFLLFPFRQSSAQIAVGLSGGGGFTRSTGFRSALPVEYAFGNNLSLFGGPAFIQRRNQEMIRKLDPRRDYFSVETDYLSLPLQIKLSLDWTPLRIYGLAGVEVNYGLRLQATGLEDQRLFKERLHFEPLGISRWDAGLSVGAGFESELRRRRKIFADLRYYLGITDLDLSESGEIYHEGAYVTLGFLMPLRR